MSQTGEPLSLSDRAPSAARRTKITRRDSLHLIGKRAARLSDAEAVIAWRAVASGLMELGDLDLPKFKHVREVIRRATIAGKKKG